MFGSIANLKRNGLDPRTIIDVGAHVGDWTRTVRRTFPDAAILMVEADPERRPALERVKQELRGPIDFHIAVLGALEKEAVPFYRMSSGAGSSVLEEQTTFSREIVTLPMTTLDRLVHDRRLQGPFLLKLDVQGYELEVLRGAKAILADVEAILAEVSVLPYNRAAPLLADVVAFLAARGFVAYDVCSLARRESDGALFQTDVIFVPDDHPLRQRRRFWPGEPDRPTP
jgi:FkbM family methyltransferase